MEEWRDIEGYEGLYQVSNEGRVKSVQRVIQRSNGRPQTINEKILSQGTNFWGYKYVSLSNQFGHKTFTVHRLVAKTFIPNPNNYEDINHKNEDKTLNTLENLEWCTAKYNANYGTRTQKQVETARKNGYYEKWSKRLKDGLYWKKVRKYSESGDFVKEYQSIIDAAKENKCFAGDISRCCKGIRKTCGGSKWGYA